MLSNDIDRWTLSHCPPSSQTVHLADHRQSEKVWFLIFIATSRVDNCSAPSQIHSLSLERACRTTNFVLSCSGIESRTFHWKVGLSQNWGSSPSFLGKTDWQRTAIRGECKSEGISEASLSQNWGASPSILGKGPPLKNGQFRGQKHLAHAPNFFHSFIIYTKFTFCKKIGQNRPIQTSAVVRI